MSERGHAGTYFLKFFPDFCTGESGGSLGSFFVSASLRAKVAAAATLFRLSLSVQTELMNPVAAGAHETFPQTHTKKRRNKTNGQERWPCRLAKDNGGLSALCSPDISRLAAGLACKRRRPFPLAVVLFLIALEGGEGE